MAIPHPKNAPRKKLPILNAVDLSKSRYHSPMFYYCGIGISVTTYFEKEMIVHDLFAVRCPLVHPLAVHPAETHTVVSQY